MFPAGSQFAHQLLGSPLGENRTWIQGTSAAVSQKVTDGLGAIQSSFSPTRPEGIGSDDHGNSPAMPSNRHLFALGNSVQDLGKGGSGLTHADCPRHWCIVHLCTYLYNLCDECGVKRLRHTRPGSLDGSLVSKCRA